MGTAAKKTAPPAPQAKVRLRNHGRTIWYFTDIDMDGEIVHVVLGDDEAKVDKGEASPEVDLDTDIYIALMSSKRYGKVVQALLDNGTFSRYGG